MNAAAIRLLIAKGLDASDIAEVAEALERKKDNTNAERQARHRAKKNGGKVTRYSNGVTPPIEEIITPPDISPSGESQSERVDECAQVAAAWNAMAKPLELSACAKMAGKRRQACLARLRDDGLSAIQQAIERIPKSAFLRGEVGNWSGASIEFILKPGTVTKILEGQYDDRTKSQSASNDEITNGFARVVAAKQAARFGDERRESGGWP